MGPAALHRSGDAGQDFYQSRGSAALIAVAVHIGLLLLFLGTVGRTFIREPPALEPMLARLIEQPRGQHQDSERLALRPRFIKPTLRLADTPPNLPSELPIEIPPAPTPSEMSASLPTGRKDVAGEGSPRGNTQGDEEGSGPAILHQVAPVYSAASVRAHEHGTVTLRVLVDAQGAPSQIRLAGSSGFPRLDQSATDAVQRYRFSPPTREAPAHGSWTTVNVEFDLLRMPVPTSVVEFDSAIAEQIAQAARTKPGIRLDILKITPRVNGLADRLLDTLAHGSESDPRQAHSPPTPIQRLARQGTLRSVRFVGFASNGFDCGTVTPPSNPRDARCEIFEVQQSSGNSYWLALVGKSGTWIENLAIAAAATPLHAANLPRPSNGP